jgi:hypothetical protein
LAFIVAGERSQRTGRWRGLEETPSPPIRGIGALAPGEARVTSLLHTPFREMDTDEVYSPIKGKIASWSRQVSELSLGSGTLCSPDRQDRNSCECMKIYGS